MAVTATDISSVNFFHIEGNFKNAIHFILDITFRLKRQFETAIIKQNLILNCNWIELTDRVSECHQVSPTETSAETTVRPASPVASCILTR